MTDLTKIDTNAIADGVRSKVRLAIADILPEDAWKALVDAEVQRFLKDQRETSRYGDVTTVKSGLSRIITEELERETRERIKALLASPEWKEHWDGTRNVVGEAIKQMAIDAAPAIMQSVVAQMIQGVVYNMQHNR